MKKKLYFNSVILYFDQKIDNPSQKDSKKT